VQEQVVEAIAQLRRRRVLESISGAMGRVPRVSDDAAQRELVRKAARGSILQMRRKLAAFDKDIRDARRYRRHHEMRISAKHLRYTMEILAGVYGRKLDPFIEEVKELQKRLGELHDCDVWLEYLPRFERRERTRTIEYFGDGAAVKELAPGIKAVARDRAKARPKLHGWSLKQWQRMAPSSRWWRELDDLLRQCT
jgi:CHAD domain-containing protein